MVAPSSRRANVAFTAPLVIERAEDTADIIFSFIIL
jgi:hypothetical protein